MTGSSTRRPKKCEAQPRSSRTQVQYQGPQFEIICNDTPIQFVVKWFNPKRGFGFVIRLDGSGDAFLHRNVLAQAGIDTVEPGAVFKARVARNDQGLYVAEVLSVENSSIVPATQGFQKTTYRRPSIEEAGMVKSFNIKRGYGFIARCRRDLG
jgi:cold shock CspA family protein